MLNFYKHHRSSSFLTGEFHILSVLNMTFLSLHSDVLNILKTVLQMQKKIFREFYYYKLDRLVIIDG